MSVFIALEIDDFQKTFNDQTSKGKSAIKNGSNTNVRRPVRGLEINDDTYAIIRVVRADGSQISLFDSGAADGSGLSQDYANFLIQTVSEARMEKQQIVETFGEPYIFFFGESPRFIDVQAILLNSFDFNWRAEWWENYDKYLRGTRLVELGARMYLFYEDMIIEGYMLNAQAQESSENPLFLQLQFRMFVTNYTNVSFIGDPFYPIRSGAVPPPGVADLTNMDAWSQLTPASTVTQDPQQAAQEAFLQALRASAQDQIQQQVLNAQNLDTVLTQQQQIAQQQAIASSGGLFSTSYLTSVLQQGLNSTAFPSQDIEGFLFNVQQFLSNAQATLNPGPAPNLPQHATPIRSKIADNKDEYTQGSMQSILPGGWQPGSTAPGVDDPTLQPGAPVGAPSADPLNQLNQQACMRGAQMPPSSYYGLGLVPYSPNSSFTSPGPYGKPLGGVGGGGGAGSGFGPGGTVGTPFFGGAGGTAVAGAYAGQSPFSLQSGFGGAPGSIASLILGNQSFSSQGSSMPGVGLGYRAAFSRSYGYTAGVGGAYGGAMGGAFGPGVAGGMGNFGSDSFGNPAFPQSGNALTQQFGLSSYGLPTGSPYGLGYSDPNDPTTQSVYRYTAGIAPDGTLQSTDGINPIGVPGSSNGGFGSTLGGQSNIFGGGADMAAVSSLGPGVVGDGVFGMQSVPGTLDPTLQGNGAPCA